MRVLLGMSGGVDSSYAALKLKESGHDVEGAVLLMHEYTEVDDAREAAESVGIPIHVIDAREAFSRVVVGNFISEYAEGRTPNPCIICNSEVKFRLLCDFARRHGFDKIATGHYASIGAINYADGIRYAVKYSADEKKDQTYMLWRLPQDILSMLIFPLSDIKKEDIRRDSKKRGLFAADRGDSQEICFIPDGDYASYIENRIGKFPEGDFVDSEGRVLGKHNGLIRYTVGQRKGLGIALGSRAFVTDIDKITNKITLSTKPKYPSSFFVESLVFSGIPEPIPGTELSLSVKVRYTAPRVRARVVFCEGDTAEVYLSEGGRALTLGQSAVFYEGDTVAFGGIISGLNQVL